MAGYPLLSDIIAIYKNDDSVQALTHLLLSTEKSRVRIKGLAGSAHAVIIATVLSNASHTYLVIANDKEEAAFLYTDLMALLPSVSIFFFPSAYRKSAQYGQTLPDAIVQRTDTLAALPALGHEGSGKAIVVTYPDALCEKVVSQTSFEKNTVTISLSEKISQEFLVDFLDDMGFQRVEFVYEPGHYSLRGSIVDIFSYSSYLPYRIDFFGDSVESIRSFDVDTQLSKESLESVIIVPNLQVEPKDETLSHFIEQLPGDTILWIRDWEVVKGRMNEVHELAGKSDRVSSGEEFLALALEHSVVEFGIRPLLSGSQTVDFNMTPQPSFKKNFELLGKNISEYADQGYQTYILAENPAQLERLKNIFENINQKVTFSGIVSTLHEGFTDHSQKISLFTDHQLFERYQKYRFKNELSKRDGLTIKELISLKPGDYVVHIDHGIGVFGGLVKTNSNGKVQEAVRITYKDGDTLLVNIHALHRISKYREQDSEKPKIYKLGSGAWQRLKQNAKRKVKDIAKELIVLYAKRNAEKGFAFSPDTYLQEELEASFIYEDTPDQVKATQAQKEDMEKPVPMDRLVCGDVGFGKTEVAIRAAFKAVTDSKQVAVLVPTTILALQHYQTFSQRLTNFPCTVDFISRMKSAKKQKETLAKLAEGKIDILIGTHALLGNNVVFKDMGLVIVDEEQKFGVAAKEKLKKLKLNVDTLTLTATPIPRTLQFSLMGARDLSIINTPPPNRYPIVTELHPFNMEIIKEAIEYEVNRGGQVFFVHNRVDRISHVQTMIEQHCPNIATVVAHGQMEPSLLEKTMLDFICGDFDVLISTSIIESGLDIPNANTIIINNAHMFGLSDLHQLRGRVGRSNKKAFCYLITPPIDELTSEARRRLKAIEEFSELGSGFNIAMQDLDIRGAGNILGSEQSGFIAEIGFETYHKILDEALQELREETMADHSQGELAVVQTRWNPQGTDCHIETDMELLIPEDYVSSTTERMRLYREIDTLQSSEEIKGFEDKLKDRFGAIPEPLAELLNIVSLRQLAVNLGFERIMLKNDLLIGHFVSNQLSPFYRSDTFAGIIAAIQQHGSTFQLKEGQNKLSIIVKNVKKVDQAISSLQLLGGLSR